MIQRNKNNFNPFWFAVKLLIAAAALWFIYKRVFERENATSWWDGAGSVLLEKDLAPWFILVFVLMLLNWSLEAMKWKIVIHRMENIGFLRSLEAIFSGITVSFFTPNRIGEYAGRVFHLEKADRIEATLATVIENFSQLIITILSGSFAILFVMYRYSSLPPYLENSILILLFSIVFICLLFYFNITLLETLFRRSGFPETMNHYFRIFSLYPKSTLAGILLLALIRYLVFSTQFFILLRLFGLDTSYTISMILIAATYLVMSVVPTFALTELGVRGAVATYFFGFVTLDLTAVLNASFCLWLINLAIPALIGIFFVFQFKLGRDRT